VSGAPSGHVPITGAIVAGGASSRFGGEPKGLLRVGGRRIIDRIADALRPVVETIAVVSNAPDANMWLDSTPVWRDQRDERASIVGIHTALVYAETVLVVAWDMPFVTDGLVRAIAGRLTPEVGAVVPVGPRGPEPMCAVYTRDCLDALQRALEAGDLRLTALVEHLPRVASLPLREIEKLGDPERLFFNVNTPDDLRAAEALASR
jgi:molybdopterin-guanine dinucleotide biosynthesis protein A